MLRHEFPNDPLFNEAWPFASLTAHEVINARLLHKILESFDLTIDSSDHLDTVHLRSRVLEEGSHKHQAVRLFAAGIGLLRGNAVKSLFLYEVSRLHRQLLEGFGVSSWQYQPDGIIEQWAPRSGFFSISAVSQLHLRQAGLAISSAISRFNTDALLLGARNLEDFMKPIANTLAGTGI